MKFIVLFVLLTTAESLDNRAANIFTLCLPATKCDAINLASNNFEPSKHVKFYFKTDGRSWTISRALDMNDNDFDKAKPTKVLIHGFRGSYDSKINNLIGRNYVNYHDVNVIKGEDEELVTLALKHSHSLVIVDWKTGSKSVCYESSRNRVERAGEVIAKFLDSSIGDDASMWNNLTLVGHSLGAHIAGFAGKNVKLGRVGTIIGLDPAGPLFDENDKENRLNANDADYVEIIHTNSECYGMKKAIGTVDFYVNGGDNQPNCYFTTCDHNRAVSYFAETLNSTNLFAAKRCSGDNGNLHVLMGGEPGNKGRGMSGEYCLNTNGKPPFGQGLIKLKGTK